MFHYHAFSTSFLLLPQVEQFYPSFLRHLQQKEKKYWCKSWNCAYYFTERSAKKGSGAAYLFAGCSIIVRICLSFCRLVPVKFSLLDFIRRRQSWRAIFLPFFALPHYTKLFRVRSYLPSCNWSIEELPTFQQAGLLEWGVSYSTFLQVGIFVE